MMKLSEDEFVCTNQNCRFQPLINNWNQLLQHAKEGHNVILKDQFLLELQNIYEDRYQQQNNLIQKLSQPFEFEINEWYDGRVRELKQIREMLFSQIEKKISGFIQDNINQANSYYETLFKQLKYPNNESQIIDNLLPIYHQREIYQFDNFYRICNEFFDSFLNTLNSLTLNNQHGSTLNCLDKYFNNQQDQKYIVNNPEQNIKQTQTFNRPISEQNNINNSSFVSLQQTEKQQFQQFQNTFNNKDSTKLQETSTQQMSTIKVENKLQETQKKSLKGYKNSQQNSDQQEKEFQNKSLISQQNQKQNSNQQEKETQNKSLKGYKNSQQNSDQQKQIKKQKVIQEIKKTEEVVSAQQKQRNKLNLSPFCFLMTNFSQYSLELNYHKQDSNIVTQIAGQYSSNKPQTIYLMPILQRADNFTIKVEFLTNQRNNAFLLGILNIDNFNVSMLQQPYPNITCINQNGKIFREGETDDKNYQLSKPTNEVKLVLKNNAFSFQIKKESLSLKNPMKKNANYRIFIYFDNITFKYSVE